MASEPTKVLPPQEDNDDSTTRLLPPPYPGVEQPGVTVTHVHVTPAPVITTGSQVILTSATPMMGSLPVRVTCRSCNIVITTRIQRKSTTKTHLIALLLCVLGCWPCVFIPYCTKSCRNADHYCTNCNAYIGSYQS